MSKKVAEAPTKPIAVETLVLDGISESVAYHDNQHRIVWVNRAAAESVGLTPKQLVGRLCYEVWQQRSQPCQRCLVTKAIETGRLQVGEVKTADGRIWHIRCYPIPGGHGEVARAVEIKLDITERKRAEEALWQNEERFRSVLENSLDMIYRLSLETGTYDYVSPSSRQVIGYSPKELTALGVERARSLAHPDDIQRLDENVIQLLTQAPEQGMPQGIEYRFKHKELGYRWVSDTRSVLCDERNVPVAVVGNLRDIAEHKLAEEALRESEERYRAIFTQAADSIWLVDATTGTTVEFNDRAHQNLGYTRDEFQRLKIRDFEVIESAEDVAKHIQKVVKQGADTFETKHRTKGGEIRDVLVSCSAVSVGGRDFIQSICRDVTERKQAEEALLSSEEKLRLMFESVTDGIVLTDLNGVITYANEGAMRIGGFGSKSDMVGRSAIKAITDYDRVRALADMEQLVEQESVGTEEYTLTRTDGSKYPAEISAGVLKDRAGNPAGFVNVIRDITERKRAEEELREHRHHLEELVKERTAKLQEEITERKKAEQKLERLYKKEKKLHHELGEEMKKRIEFTRALAHELKTPLTPVVISSQTLVSQLQEGPLLSLEPLMRLATNISRGASNLNSRIDELLDLARGEMGMLKLRAEPVDALLLLREVIEDVAAVASNKGQSMVSRLPHSLLLISADRTRLRQIVLNLLNNAFKFTPHGGRITLRAKEVDGNLTIEVKDTGPGISKEEQEQLFEPYHRVEHDRERLSGLGLGLALCRTLVELHGGRIWVKSGIGKGSTFGFSLPLQSSAGEQETLTVGEE